MSSLSCSVVMGLCLDTVEFEGDSGQADMPADGFVGVEVEVVSFSAASS